MTDIILCGCCGKMGKVIAECISVKDNMRIVCGVDVSNDNSCDFPVYNSFKDIDIKGDVIIDFSHPAVLNDLLDFAENTDTPCVICTTGLSSTQQIRLKELSNKIPIFYSGNMSLGINLVIALSKIACKALGTDFDIEIIEKHHNLKLDAPSGTALMIANAVSDTLENEPVYVYDRHSVRKKRDKNEIGIHSIRGGNIVGEHEIIFAGNDETVSIKHTAQSKSIFATGAVNAAEFIANKNSGFYDMTDLISEKN